MVRPSLLLLRFYFILFFKVMSTTQWRFQTHNPKIKSLVLHRLSQARCPRCPFFSTFITKCTSKSSQRWCKSVTQKKNAKCKSPFRLLFYQKSHTTTCRDYEEEDIPAGYSPDFSVNTQCLRQPALPSEESQMMGLMRYTADAATISEYYLLELFLLQKEGDLLEQ